MIFKSEIRDNYLNYIYNQVSVEKNYIMTDKKVLDNIIIGSGMTIKINDEQIYQISQEKISKG